MLETLLLPMSHLGRIKQKMCCRCRWYLVQVPWELSSLGSALAQLLQVLLQEILWRIAHCQLKSKLL